MAAERWLGWARALQAISQTGLHFAGQEYDRERYQEIGRIAAEILAQHSSLELADILTLQAAEFGYATPKVDVRGVVIREGEILLVREIADQGRWTLPGGWADVNETPSQAVIRELREESGFDTVVTKVLAVYDRDAQGHLPPHPFHIFKLFFRCHIVGGSPQPNSEASEIAFFAPDALPELSVARTTTAEIATFFRDEADPLAPTRFD
jgi:ADP-ribose pyrophosphatase YjhB (NUDIX family)